MERVFSVQSTAMLPSSSIGQRSTSEDLVLKEGIIATVLSPGNFMVVMEDGQKVEVRGSKALKTGNRVQIQFRPAVRQTDKTVSTLGTPSDQGEGVQWTALIPLGFGGHGAMARLEVFVEKRPKTAKEKRSASYFVFAITTEENGEIQWSVYLNGREVALQVYASSLGRGESLKKLVREVESTLRDRGYVFSGPAVVLNKPFRVPAGFRLNVRG